MTVSGIQLRDECRVWCRRTGTPEAMLMRAAGKSWSVEGLGRVSRPFPETIAALRDVMARHPGGLGGGIGPAVRPRRDAAAAIVCPPPARPDPAASARAVAERIERAPPRVRTPEYAAPLRRDLTRAELLASAIVDTPGALIDLVKRRWPGTWDRVLLQARADGEAPGATLLRVIEAGLEVAS